MLLSLTVCGGTSSLLDSLLSDITGSVPNTETWTRNKNVESFHVSITDSCGGLKKGISHVIGGSCRGLHHRWVRVGNSKSLTFVNSSKVGVSLFVKCHERVCFGGDKGCGTPADLPSPAVLGRDLVSGKHCLSVAGCLYPPCLFREPFCAFLFWGVTVMCAT